MVKASRERRVPFDALAFTEQAIQFVVRFDHVLPLIFDLPLPSLLRTNNAHSGNNHRAKRDRKVSGTDEDEKCTLADY